MAQRTKIVAAGAAGIVTLLAAGATAPAWAHSAVDPHDTTVHMVDRVQAVNKAHGGGGGGGGVKPSASPQLTYHGGIGGVGVERAPAVYLVYWGSQWGTDAVDSNGTHTFGNDPAGVAPYQQQFFAGLGTGESWSASTTQFCQGVASGSVTCTTSSSAVFAGQPAKALAGVLADNAVAAPSHPTQTQLGQEAVRAAQLLGPVDLTNVQFVINTARGNSSAGFGSQYCAWHSSVFGPNGNVAYTNFPYMPDAGASCGAGFVNAGSQLDGVSIVGGHEYAETITDQFPNGGWLDSAGAENGDKCAWKRPGTSGGATDISLGGRPFAVQSLWSNSFGTSGGCVVSYVRNADTGTVTQSDGVVSITK